MAGAYLEINPQETCTFTSNVLLDGAPQSLDGSTIWFQAINWDDYSNGSLFINASTITGEIAISNGTSSNVNSVVTVTLASNVTANLSQVNSGGWSLVSKTTLGAVYKLDGGRIAVLAPPSVSYQ